MKSEGEEKKCWVKNASPAAQTPTLRDVINTSSDADAAARMLFTGSTTLCVGASAVEGHLRAGSKLDLEAGVRGLCLAGDLVSEA